MDPPSSRELNAIVDYEQIGCCEQAGIASIREKVGLHDRDGELSHGALHRSSEMTACSNLSSRLTVRPERISIQSENRIK